MVNMSINPYISVIIPVYNKGVKVKRAIESVINQTYGRWELIIVDDGSTDLFTEKVLSKYEDNRKIRIIHQENKGVSAARNTGLRQMTGDYYMFLDADDWYKESMLESSVEILNRYGEDVDIILRNQTIWYDDKKRKE